MGRWVGLIEVIEIKFLIGFSILIGLNWRMYRKVNYIQKTGQTTSYTIGDDGDLEKGSANGQCEKDNRRNHIIRKVFDGELIIFGIDAQRRIFYT